MYSIGSATLRGNFVGLCLGRGSVSCTVCSKRDHVCVILNNVKFSNDHQEHYESSKCQIFKKVVQLRH